MRLRSGVALVLLALSSQNCKVTNSTGTELKAPEDEAAAAAAKEARRIRTRRFQEDIAPVVNVVMSDSSAVGESYRKAVENKMEEILNYEPLSDDQSIRNIRVAVAALAKNDISRGMLYQSTLAAQRRRSALLVDEMVKGEMDPKTSPNYYHIVIIGAGPHGAALAQQYTNENPDLKVLVVDERDAPGGTFAKVKSAFYLNSTDRANTGERARPGEGDLNSVANLLGIPDWESVKWPEGGSMGELSTILLDLSSANVALGTRANFIRENQQNGALTLDLTDVASGRDFSVSAEKIVLATGLGGEKSIFTGETAASIQREVAKLGAEKPASVEGFQTAIERIGQSETPLRPYIKQDVVVVGAGDSGRVTVQFLRRLGPPTAYKRDTAQVGNTGTVYWFAPFETCDEFLTGVVENEKKAAQGTRSRYASLFGEISSGNVKLVAGRVIDAIEVVQKDANGNDVILRDIIYETDGKRYSSLKDGFRYLDPEAFRETGQRVFKTDKKVVRHTIETVGFSPSRLGALLEPLIGPDVKEGRVALKDLTRPVTAVVPSFDNSERVIARQLGEKGVFLAGPLNDAIGAPLPLKDQLARVNANTVSLFANIELTKFLAKATSTVQRASAFTAELMTKMFPVTEKAAPVALEARPGESLTIELVPQRGIGERPLTSAPEIELKAEMARLFRRLELNGAGDITVEIAENAGKIELSIKDVSPAPTEALRALMSEVPHAYEIASRILRSGGRVNKISVSTSTFGANSKKLNLNRVQITQAIGPQISGANRPPQSTTARARVRDALQSRALDLVRDKANSKKNGDLMTLIGATSPSEGFAGRLVDIATQGKDKPLSTVLAEMEATIYAGLAQGELRIEKSAKEILETARVGSALLKKAIPSTEGIYLQEAGDVAKAKLILAIAEFEADSALRNTPREIEAAVDIVALASGKTSEPQTLSDEVRAGIKEGLRDPMKTVEARKGLIAGLSFEQNAIRFKVLENEFWTQGKARGDLRTIHELLGTFEFKASTLEEFRRRFRDVFTYQSRRPIASEALLAEIVELLASEAVRIETKIVDSEVRAQRLLSYVNSIDPLGTAVEKRVRDSVREQLSRYFPKRETFIAMVRDAKRSEAGALGDRLTTIERLNATLKREIAEGSAVSFGSCAYLGSVLVGIGR